MLWALWSPFALAQGTGLDRPISLSFQEELPAAIVQKIQVASDLPFSYNNNILPSETFSGSYSVVPLREVLDDLLPRMGLSYVFQDGIVVLVVGKRRRPSQLRTVSGYVEDVQSGERLIGASVYDLRSRQGVITNQFGYFSLQLPADSVKLVVSMVGYAVDARRFKLSRDSRFNIELVPDLSLETIVINDEQEGNFAGLGGVSSMRIPISEIEMLPALMGESDVLAALALLPGVHSGGEGATGLYVRGGGPDQNLVLYDGVPIYSSSHLFGFYSIFNSSAIKDLELVKGGFPARYGGRLSSVINIRMKEGNMKRIGGEGSLGLATGRLLVEGPIIKDKLSFVVSGRRTLLEPYLFAINQFAERNNGNSLGYSFYDLHGKLHWKVGERDGIFLTYYQGEDVFSSGYAIDTNDVLDVFDFDLNYGNAAGILRWHRDWSTNVFSDVSVFGTQYQYNSVSATELSLQTADFQRNELTNRSSVQDIGARFQIDWLPMNSQLVRMGGGIVQHRFEPEVFQQRTFEDGVPTEVKNTAQTPLRPIEANLFFEDQVKASRMLSFNLGLHTSWYLIDSTSFASMQPRLSFRIGPEGRWGIYGSYSSMTQFLHLLSNSGVGLPTDLWVPATRKVPPQRAHQFTLGMDRTLGKSGLQLSAEAYYKSQDNLIDYQTGANFLGDIDWQNRVEKNGLGESYGLELFLRKNTGRLRGWIGYTRSKTTRQFPSINFGNPFPYKYDRRNDLSVVGIYELNDRMEFSANWVYGTGTAVTFPAAVFNAPVDPFFDFWALNDGSEVNIVIVYGDRNSTRLPAYHRLDLNFRVHKERSWGETFWSFGVYNAYNRRNPYFLFLRADYSVDPQAPEIKARKLNLLPILPNVNFGFKF